MKAVYPSWVKVLLLTPFVYATACDNGNTNFVEQETPNPEEYVEGGTGTNGSTGGDAIGRGDTPQDMMIPTTPNDLTPADKAEIIARNNAGRGAEGPGSGGGAGDDGQDNGGGGNGLSDRKGGKWSGTGTSKYAPELALAHWSFDASAVKDGSMNYYPDGGDLVQTVQMESNLAPTSLSFTQATRPVVTEVFAQGSNKQNEGEKFKQNSSASGLLDILIVVDNSGSMIEEQQNLSTKLQPLLSYVSNSDWRIGVVTSDPSDGCLRGLISKNDQNASAAFATAVVPGTKGSGNERGIFQAVSGLKGECNPNGSWLRSNSTVAVLIVSDEDNCSDGKGCGNDPWKDSSYLTDYLGSIRQLGVNSRVYGLIGHPSQTAQQCKAALNKGYIYADVISQSSGTWGSICDSDYTQTLQSISQNISGILLSQFTLKYEPFPASVKVKVNGTLLTSGYTVKGRIVEFANPPAVGAQIDITYDFSSSAPAKEFALKGPADPSTLKVFLDGVENKSFTYNSGKVVFADAPMVYEVKTVYKPGDLLKKDFSIGKTAAAESVEVAVAGKKLARTEYGYSSNSGLVTLKAAPVEDAAIKIDFANLTVPRLNYPIYTGVAANTQVSVKDQKTGDTVAFQMENGQITFPADEFEALRNVEVIFFMANQGWTVDMGYLVEAGSVRAEGANGSICTNVAVNGSTIDMSACNFASNEAVSIAFRYEMDKVLTFDLGEVAMNGKEAWEVKVNGEFVEDYLISAGVLSFQDIPAKAKIEVTLYKTN